MAIMTHATFHFNWLMLTLIFGIWASEPPPGPGERLKRPGLIGLIRHRALVKRLLSQGYKVNRLSNTFKKFYGRHTDLVGQYKKNVCQMFADSIS